MPCPGIGPCKPWDLDLCCIVSGGLPDPCTLDGEPVPQDVIDSAVLAASQYMWAATGRQFGCCQVLIRPTQNPDGCGCNDDMIDKVGFPWIPAQLSDGSWTNISCLCGQDPCGCPPKPCQIELPYPVCSIDQVKIDGQIIGKTLYRVDDFRKLIFTPGVKDVHQSMATATGPVGGPIVAGDVSVVGPGITLATDGAGTGVSLSTVPGSYQINFASPKRDLVFKFHVPPGTIGSMNFFLAGGDFTVVEGDGHFFPPGVVKFGQNVSWSNPSDAGTGADFFIIAHDSGFTNQVNIDYLTGFTTPNNLRLMSVSWTDNGVGMDCFPKCNNLALTDDEVGTFSVLLTYGRPVPEMVRKGAAELACQLIKHCIGAPCQLPARLTSISRQGMTASFLDPMEFLKLGMTGIYLADLAIKTYNPHGLMKRAWVGSPDSIGKWHVTTWENKSNGREDPFGPNCT